ncbi:MAG TPA: CCA tRNA nucleotidyltransferase [Verrucomicrobiae bacterium]|nr:CCA tRNA nucleotidyltransferase [Verrucomicrobiae bacterium]
MPSDPAKTIAQKIVGRLQQSGFAAFWVGGCVRDFLLGREPQDFDIATDARPEQIEALFPKTIPVGRKFGVIIVVEDGHQFQVATFRAEAEYRDGRRPAKVSFASAEADALRRDFTVNGLFYDPLTEKTHDWVGGGKDLRAKTIRAIGPPEERFAEDHLRLLRAVRFAAQLGFEIEPQTFAAIKTLAPKIRLISAERIHDELIKLFAPPRADFFSSASGGDVRSEEAEVSNIQFPSPRPSPRLGGEREKQTPAARGLVLLRDSGLLAQILPELATTISCEQSPDYHPEGTVFEHIRLMLDKLPPGADELLPWAVLLHDIAKPVTAEKDLQTGAIHFYGHEKIGAEMARVILSRLRFPKKQIDEIVVCVRNHMQFKDVKQMRKATLRRLLLRPTFRLELELHRLDCLGSHGDLSHYNFLMEQAEELKRKPKIRPPLLNGKDLIALGMKPGPAMGKLLAEIREKQLADELKTRRQAKAWVGKELRRLVPGG